MKLLNWLIGNDAKASPSKYVNKRAREVVEHLRIGGEARLVAARDYEIPLFGGRWPLIVSTKTVPDRQGKEVVTLEFEGDRQRFVHLHPDDVITVAPR